LITTIPLDTSNTIPLQDSTMGSRHQEPLA
jgi:hypothetical protein